MIYLMADPIPWVPDLTSSSSSGAASSATSSSASSSSPSWSFANKIPLGMWGMWRGCDEKA